MTDVRAGEGWPALRVDDWEPTRRSLHMWSQIVGKVRLAHAPLLNHWWQVPLYVSPRGLTTSAIPVGTDSFDIEFDFVDHALTVRVSDGGAATIDLRDTSVARFHEAVLDTLSSLGIDVRISDGPNEVDPAIPFAEDTHAGYDPTAANAFWRQLVQADRVLGQFRARFIGKVSPVHFFWGSFDLACSRFSGRLAPRHPGGAPNCGDWVMEEGYSHELSSCGFWPGGGEEGAFYSYAYPEPAGYRRGRGPSRRRLLRRRVAAVPVALRGCTPGEGFRRGGDGLPRVRLRRGRRFDAMGPARPRDRPQPLDAQGSAFVTARGAWY